MGCLHDEAGLTSWLNRVNGVLPFTAFHENWHEHAHLANLKSLRSRILILKFFRYEVVFLKTAF